MQKKLIALFMALLMAAAPLGAAVNAAVEAEEDIPEQISSVKSVYKPGETYFVANSTQKWVGEDNIAGDKTLGCDAAEVTNSHGRFGGLWQSMGFANYVFYNIFGEMPQFDYHCNPSKLNDKVEVIGRYASNCRYLRGEIDGKVTVENIKALLSNAKRGDILVAAPKKNCNMSARAMVVESVTDAYISVYHADYKGNCAVTEDIITYDALADFHVVSLLRSAAYPYPQPVPPSAVEEVTLSGKEFSLNENVSITWPSIKSAEGYKVFLIDENDTAVQSDEVEGAVTSFVFKNPGKYRVKVIAGNRYGDSAAVYSEEIVVHNQNIVNFKDYDGTVITTQKVEYGKNAVAPNIPHRKGYQFAGWDKSLQNIKEPTDITATYEVEKYTITYYDIGGKKTLGRETVEYQGKANLPTNYTITEGFVFAGWQISYDSVGTDYNCVDGNMSLIATEKWANLNLPITIAVDNPYRAADGTKYTASLTIRNQDTAAGKNVKIIGTLKSADGKALKIVVLHELALAAGESVTRNIEIVYSEKATTMEFVAIGMVGNSKTGGAFSKTISASILDNTSWGSWTDWTDVNNISLYDAYETKTQYRFRNKSYTTSSSSSLSGWTWYSRTESVGNWSDWSTTSVSAFENASQKREVQSQYIAPIYKTQYRYGRWTNGYYLHFCPNYAKSLYGGSWYKQYTAWFDRAVSPSATNKWRCSVQSHTHVNPASYSGSLAYWNEYTVSGKPYYWQETQQVQIGGNYYKYSYRDTYYTHHFWKWGEWSPWSDFYSAGDETETRTVYRYRNRSESGEVEDTSGEVFTVSGTLNNVESDFSGMTASVMVYKKCNTDPTEEQLEYVGQITIGAGNTYAFEFKPREMPSGETGEFIVALGIEGADRLVNVDVIEAEAPTYQVQFTADGAIIEDPSAEDVTDSGGNAFRVQLVREGETAIAPEPPVKEGYHFVKWSETLTDIKMDKIIKAEYEPNEYSLVFIDWDTGTVTTEKLRYGDTIIYPSLEAVVGANSRTWDKQLEGIEFVTDNMIIGSVSELKEYTVSFEMNDEVVSTQTVKHGQKAVLPEAVPAEEGMVFAGWVGACSYEYITQDTVFIPSFLYSKTVSMPEAVVTKNSDGSSTVELSCATEGAEIYYIIESCLEDTHLSECHEAANGICDESFGLMDESFELLDVNIINQHDSFKASATPYTGEITLAANQTITFIAYAEGMNESIPATEMNEDEFSYYGLTVGDNTIRQYRNSVEGSIVVNILNELPEYEHGTVTLCFYDDKGIMVGIIPQAIEVIPGINKVEFNDIKLTGTRINKASSITCKVMSWLEGETITPISDVLEFTLD